MVHRPTEHQYQTMLGLVDGGWHTARELLGEGLDYGKARRALVHLERSSIVERRDAGSTVFWRITEAGRQELTDEETLRTAQAALAEELADATELA